MRKEETEVRRKEVTSENLRNLRQLFIGGCFPPALQTITEASRTRVRA